MGADTENLRWVQASLDPPVARITLSRPEKLNALNQAVLEQLHRTFAALTRAEGVRAVILTGAGEKAFAAGADIAELATLTPEEAERQSRRGQATLAAIANCPAPVIAAIHGYALGGGLELALACHIRLASETAKLGQPEVKLGMIPGYGGTQRLPRVIGTSAALRMILSGEPISAAEALRLGLVDQVTPAQDLLPAAERLASQIAAAAPLAVRYALQAVRAGTAAGLAAGLALEASLFGLSCASEDMREGTRAFIEKRAARFNGR